MIADEAVAVAEHEGEADGVEEQAAETGVDDALHQHVDGFARAAEAGLEHGEADLHAEDEEGGDQRPHGVDGIDDVGGLDHRSIGSQHLGETEFGDEGGDQHDRRDTQHFSRKQDHAIATPLSILQALAQPADLLRER